MLNKNLKKRLLFCFTFLVFQTVFFARDYKCTFVYKVAGTSGTGKCTEGTDPIVKIDFENKKITFPDFVFTESKTIPAYTVSGVEMITRAEGTIEIQKDRFEVNQDGKTITGKKLYGTVKGNALELEVVLKVGKMPFNLKVLYYSETTGTKQRGQTPKKTEIEVNYENNSSHKRNDVQHV